MLNVLCAGDKRDERSDGVAVDTDHVGGQQVRRERHTGGVGRGRGRRGPAVGLPLHGDVGQDQPQREGAVPGAAQPGEEQEHIAAARKEIHARPQDTGEVCAHVVRVQLPGTLAHRIRGIHNRDLHIYVLTFFFLHIKFHFYYVTVLREFLCKTNNVTVIN